MIQRLALMLLFTGCLNSGAHGQVLDRVNKLLHNANKLGEQAEYRAAIDTCETALTLLNEFSEPNDSTVGLTYFMMGRCYQLLGEWDASINYIRESAKQYEKAFGRYHIKSGDALYSIARQMAMAGQYDSVAYYYREALEIYKTIDEPLDEGWAYRALGEALEFQGAYQAAMEANEKAVSILVNLPEKKPKLYAKRKTEAVRQLSLSYLNLSSLYALVNDYDASIDYAQQAQQLIKENEALHSTMQKTLYINQAKLYEQMGDIDRSLTTYETLLEGGKNQEAPVEKRQLYLEMANLANSSNKLDKSTDYLKAAYQLSQKIQSTDSLHFAEVELARAENFRLSGQAQLAVELLHWVVRQYQQVDNFGQLLKTYEALSWAYSDLGAMTEALRFNQKALDLFIPTSETQQQLLVSPDYAELKAAQGYFLWQQYKQKQSGTDLVKAGEALQESIAILEAFEQQLFQQKTFLSIYSKIYDWYLNVLFEQYQLSPNEELKARAFDLMERSKANMLLASESWRTLPALPEEVVKREEETKAVLVDLRHKIFEATNSDTHTAKIEEWKKEVFQNVAALQGLKAEIQQNYPAYYAAKYDRPILQFEAVKNYLPNTQTAIIEFFEGQDNLFVFILDKKNSTWLRISYPESLQQNIRDFRQLIATHPSKTGGFEQSINQIKAIGKSLYNQCLFPVLNQLNEGLSELVLIPDGLLNYIPFEAVPTNSAGQYLIHDFTISYAYSLSFWKNQLTAKRKKTKHFFAGFAPNYSQIIASRDTTLRNPMQGQLLPLPGAKAEVEQIAKLLEGQAYLDEAANLNNFLSHAPQYKVLHLAMHASVENQNPAFSKLIFDTGSATEKITAMELYHLRFSADLAVLSACNSGFGRSQKGEAVMSLSHAFSYAGIPSTVMSLWQIPDGYTKDLMVDFYSSLQQKNTKSSALREAKIKHLNEWKGLPAEHPYFWASFIASGNMTPIYAKSSWYLIPIILIVLILIVLLLRVFLR
jgi:CHAT domain-containing protein